MKKQKDITTSNSYNRIRISHKYNCLRLYFNGEIRTYIIYETRFINENLIYVGIHHQDERIDPYEFDGYFGSGSYLKKLIEKYGETCFERKTLFVYENKDVGLAYQKEAEIVNDGFLKRKDVLNLVRGGLWWKSEHGSSKNTIWVYKDDISLRIDKNLLENMINRGFSKGRPKSHKEAVKKGMNGQIWMKKGDISAQVSKDKIDIFLQNGWVANSRGDVAGLKVRFKKNPTVFVHKDKLEKRIFLTELDTYLKEGWVRGCPESGLATQGKIAISYPETLELKYVKEEEISKYEEIGWVRGNLEKTGKLPFTIGKIAIHKDGHNLCILKEEYKTKYKKDGWILGGRKKKNVIIS